MSKPLTEQEKVLIEEKKKKALEIRKLKRKDDGIPHVGAFTVVKTADEPGSKQIIVIDGKKFHETDGGFLIQVKDSNNEEEEVEEINTDIDPNDDVKCLECNLDFETSYLKKIFDYNVCDDCRDSEEKHCLITKTDAKDKYLLKDVDLDIREPILKYIVKKNPHHSSFAEMKLYLELQVTKRALEIYDSLENIEEEREKRIGKKLERQKKQYQQKMKNLRMNVRSSLYDLTKRNKPHKHEFGPETYIEEQECFTKTCTICGYTDTYEEM